MNSPETDRLKSSLIPVGAENVLYITIPYKGCPLKCVFCGVREKMDRALKIDGGFGGKSSSKGNRCKSFFSRSLESMGGFGDG